MKDAQRKQEILDYVLRFHAQYGYGPSIGTIAAHFGYAGEGSLVNGIGGGHIGTLLASGHLAYRTNADGENVRNTLHVVKPVWENEKQENVG